MGGFAAYFALRSILERRRQVVVQRAVGGGCGETVLVERDAVAPDRRLLDGHDAERDQRDRREAGGDLAGEEAAPDEPGARRG